MYQGRGIMLAAAALVACHGNDAAKSGSGSGSASASAPTPTELGSGSGSAAGVVAPPTLADSGSATVGTADVEQFTYPPPGDGPFKGSDLAALRMKLQGTWLVGGVAFGGIPTIWSITGDDLIEIDQTGARSEHTIELLAPCLARVADKGGSSATYKVFAFDGDTLYQGLGSAAVVDGARTIACVSSGVYVLEAGKCVGWTNDSFVPRAERWKPDAGTCGLRETGAFYTDDATAKRPLYGVEELPEHIGSTFLTSQMKNNQAKRATSLDAATAEQTKAIAATKAPTTFVFSTWGLPVKELTAAAGSRVWAAAVDRDGKWRLASYRFQSAAAGTATLSGMSDAWAPTTFVEVALAAAPAVGTPAVVITGTELWGHVDSVKDGQVMLRYLSADKVATRSWPQDSVRSFPARGFTLGAPVVVTVADNLVNGMAVADVGDQVYVYAQNGSAYSVAPYAKAAVKAVDGSVRLKVGTKVMVKQASGTAPLHFVPGKVTKVLGDGAGYEVKADDGAVIVQSWPRVVKP